MIKLDSLLRGPETSVAAEVFHQKVLESFHVESRSKRFRTAYHTVTPHLIVRDAAKAIDFYKKAFGAEELMRMPGPDGSIMHAEIRVGDSNVMLGDENPGMGCKSPATLGGSPVSFYVYVKDVDAAWKRAVDAAGIKCQCMALADMFWGDRTGQLEDPFGHHWSLSQHVKDLAPGEIKKGQETFFAQMKGKKPYEETLTAEH